MDVRTYFQRTGESKATFARRAGIPLRTLYDCIARGYASRGTVASRLVAASGGMITLVEAVTPLGASVPAPQNEAASEAVA